MPKNGFLILGYWSSPWQVLVAAVFFGTQLGLPKYYEEWEVLAILRDLSRRQLQFILMDQTETRFPGQYRIQPQQVTLPPHVPPGIRASGGFVVEIVSTFLLGFEELRAKIPSLFGVEWSRKADHRRLSRLPVGAVPNDVGMLHC